MDNKRILDFSRRDFVRTGFVGTGLLGVGGVGAAGLFFGGNQRSFIETPYGAEPSEEFHNHISGYSSAEGNFSVGDDVSISYLAEKWESYVNDVPYVYARIRSRGELWYTRVRKSKLEELKEDVEAVKDFGYWVVDPKGDRPKEKVNGYSTPTGRLLAGLVPFSFPDFIDRDGDRYYPVDTFSSETAAHYVRGLAIGVRWYRRRDASQLDGTIFDVLRYDENGDLIRRRYFVSGGYNIFNLTTIIEAGMAGQWHILSGLLRANRDAVQAAIAIARGQVGGIALGATEAAGEAAGAQAGITLGKATGMEALAGGLMNLWPQILGFLLVADVAAVGTAANGLSWYTGQLMANLDDVGMPMLYQVVAPEPEDENP